MTGPRSDGGASEVAPAPDGRAVHLAPDPAERNPAVAGPVAGLRHKGARGLAPAPRGRRSTGKIVRDSLLILVILAMGLPFVVAAVGGVKVSTDQQDLVRFARRAAYTQQDWLSNSMSHKVVVAKPLPAGGVHIRENYYTFWGLPWGWSEADVSAAGEVSGLRTGLSIRGSF